MSKKDCAFQYAIVKGSVRGPGLTMSGQVEIIEDTPLITFEQAKKLWNKYLPDFKEKLTNGEEPQMGIWIKMKDTTDYHTVGHELDWRDEIELKNGRIYKIERIEIGGL